MANLKEFINPQQLHVLMLNIKGEESTFFVNMLNELHDRIDGMASTGETDGKGENARVVLRYTFGNYQWFITEKDSVEGEPQYQAFGYADMGFPELGYISIDDLITNNVEMDLYFTPKTLGEVKKEYF